jgi:hypothetical protein
MGDLTKGRSLLNFAFDKLNMLPHDWVVLVHAQFFGLGAGVLLGHIEEAGASRRVQADFDGGRFGHDKSPAVAVWVNLRGRLDPKPSQRSRLSLRLMLHSDGANGRERDDSQARQKARGAKGL